MKLRHIWGLVFLFALFVTCKPGKGLVGRILEAGVYEVTDMRITSLVKGEDSINILEGLVPNFLTLNTNLLLDSTQAERSGFLTDYLLQNGRFLIEFSEDNAVIMSYFINDERRPLVDTSATFANACTLANLEKLGRWEKVRGGLTRVHIEMPGVVKGNFRATFKNGFKEFEIASDGPVVFSLPIDIPNFVEELGQTLSQCEHKGTVDFRSDTVSMTILVTRF